MGAAAAAHRRCLMNEMENGQAPGDERRRHHRHGYIQLVLVIVFIGGAFWLSRWLATLQTSPVPEQQTGLLVLPVETALVAPRDYRLQFDTTGTVQVRAMTDLVPQVSGRIVAVDDNAFPGGHFTPDTVLFEIDPKDFRLEVARSEAEVARATTRLKLQQESSRAAVDEWRQLNPGVPVPPLVAERPQLEEAESALEAAQAQLQLARLNLARTDFRLPFAGRVTAFQLEQGQYVVAGQSYGQAYALSALEIDVPLEDRQLAWLLEAQDPLITVSSAYRGGSDYRAFVKRVAGKVDPETRFSRVVLGLETASTDLVPDVFVTVHIVGPIRRDVWTLPLDALQENDSIWTVTPDGKLASRRPEIIQINDTCVVAESDGSAIQVVRGNLPEATEGTPVRSVDAAPEEEQADDAHR